MVSGFVADGEKSISFTDIRKAVPVIKYEAVGNYIKTF